MNEKEIHMTTKEIRLDKKYIKQVSDNEVSVPLEEIVGMLPSDLFFEHSKKEIQAIIDCIHDGIYITDGEGITLMWNQAEIDYTAKWNLKNCIGKNVREMVEEGYWDKSISLEVIKSGKTESFIQQVDGKRVLTTGIPYFEDGKLTRIIATDRNISELEELQGKIKAAEDKIEKYKTRYEYERNIGRPAVEELVFKSDVMADVVNSLYKVAAKDVTVLIQGESGCGKEMIADFIVKHSSRVRNPFIKVNCGAIPDTLIESELFGYESGAFTGANPKGKIGLFEAAEGGTLLLDEIGELPLNTQAKLLRVLQENELIRIGGNKTIPINVRIIAATNADLKQKIMDGQFRADLYYRLNIVPVEIPPLRERREDIEALVKHFFDMHNKKHKTDIYLEEGALEAFMDYEWPGNVRELKNLIERLIVTADGRSIDKASAVKQIYNDDIMAKMMVSDLSLQEQMENFERKLLETALEKAGNGSGVARLLKINKSTVSKKFKKYDIKTQV